MSKKSHRSASPMSLEKLQRLVYLQNELLAELVGVTAKLAMQIPGELDTRALTCSSIAERVAILHRHLQAGADE